MGPRPFGRGRPKPPLNRPQTPPLQWGRDLSAAEGNAMLDNWAHAYSRFNGAATFRPRKDFTPARRVCAISRLQWGRDLSAAEGVRRGPTTTVYN